MTRPSSGRSVGAAHYDQGVAPAERPVRAVAVATALGTAGAAAAILVLVSALADGSSPAWGGVAAGWVVAVTALIVVAQSLTVLWRRRVADAAWLTASALPIVVAVAVPGELYSVTAFPVLVASFLAGLQAPLRRAAPWGAGAAAAIALGHVVNGLGLGRTDLAGLALEALAQAVLVVGAPLLPAAVIRAQREARAAQQDRLDALTRERDAQVGAAVARERTEMARELHDIAAHHLSGIALRAAAVEAQVATDPEAARAGAREIRAQSRDVLDDLRRLVGLLRDDPADTAVKTLATLPELVGAAASAGMSVVLERRPRGESPGDVAPLAQLAVYRMVQESLSNARRHAPGAAGTVLLDATDPHILEVVVRNAAPPNPPAPASGPGGFGIVGMTERASLIGGRFDAGPTADGGWQARMRVPRTGAPETGESP